LRTTGSRIEVVSHLLAPLSRECGILTVINGYPATLAWIGDVNGHRVKALGVEHFGQTGTIADLYRHYGLDANAIMHAARAVSTGRGIRYLRSLP
jgi:pyruvate dehydrogenase E1 component